MPLSTNVISRFRRALQRRSYKADTVAAEVVRELDRECARVEREMGETAAVGPGGTDDLVCLVVHASVVVAERARLAKAVRAFASGQDVVWAEERPVAASPALAAPYGQSLAPAGDPYMRAAQSINRQARAAAVSALQDANARCAEALTMLTSEVEPELEPEGEEGTLVQFLVSCTVPQDIALARVQDALTALGQRRQAILALREITREPTAPLGMTPDSTPPSRSPGSA